MRALLAIAIVLLLALIGSIGLVYFGSYNVAASDPHWNLTQQILDAVKTRSIKAHASGITVPADLDKPDRLVIGVEHFAAHCAVCHGGPGVPKGDIGKGLYPAPPDLAAAAHRYTAPELFWIIKNGIKMTGMPSWADHSDDEIWATVAFLQKLGGGMTEQQYGELIRASMTHTLPAGGHHH
jgi:mono/diheme cytochrome c family protein